MRDFVAPKIVELFGGQDDNRLLLKDWAYKTIFCLNAFCRQSGEDDIEN